jgi:DNA-binding transcriptional regulator YdaS (Cro superfamily)
MDHGLLLIRLQRGAQARIARELGLSRSAVTQWRRVPADRLIDIERITGIPRRRLRPDLFAPRDKAPGPV